MRSRFMLAFALVALGSTTAARAADSGPFQLALVDPIQIIPRDQGVAGFGLNFLYGRNAFLRGVELGLVNHVTGDVAGAQWGAVNIVGGNYVGLQDGLVSITGGKFEGLQVGLVALSKSTSGVQFGFVNHAERAEGLQLGLVNHAATMHGLQIGLVNVIEHGGWLPVMVIVNGSF